MLAEAQPVAITPTTDAERSKAFYGDVLGLPFVDDDGFALVFQLAGVTLRVTRVEAFKPHPFAVLSWYGDNLDDTLRELGLRGVEFESYRHLRQDELEIWTALGGARVAWFKDPDGNTLSVSQPPG